MDLAQNVTIEPEEEEEETAFSTFLRPAAEMPSYDEDQMKNGLDKKWRERMTKLFRQAGSGAAKPERS